jgi:branched-chain amino acid aminotransferase
MSAGTGQAQPRFGTVFSSEMAITWYRDGQWSAPEIRPLANLPLHPAAHVLHYASSIFEGFKAYRWDDGSVHIFRLDRHLERMRHSAELLCLEFPGADAVGRMVRELVDRCRGDIPKPPGALYIRPVLIGTVPDIGAAAIPAREQCLYVLVGPVGDYFSGGLKPLRILVDEQHFRTAPHLGMVKTGANYAAALRHIVDAKQRYGVDQVLFCPGGDVQETGAANFLLIRDGQVLTKRLDPSFLHGVTRDSILTIAADLGYEVEERDFSTADMLAWVAEGEAALSGTAAVLTPVGTLILGGEEHRVGNGGIGPQTMRLREALVEIQHGRAADRHGWLSTV